MGRSQYDGASRQRAAWNADLVKIRILDVVAGPEIRTRAIVIQQKTSRPVQFEITSDVRASLLAWLERRGGSVENYVFPSGVDHAKHMPVGSGHGSMQGRLGTGGGRHVLMPSYIA